MSKNLRKPQQKFPSLKYLASAVGLARLPLAPAFLLLWPGLAHSWGSSLAPEAPSREGRAGGRSLSVGFGVSLGPCLEAQVFGNWEGEERISKALGGGRVQWAPSSPRVQPWGHLWGQREKLSGEREADRGAPGTCLHGLGTCGSSWSCRLWSYSHGTPCPSQSGPLLPPRIPPNP